MDIMLKGFSLISSLSLSIFSSPFSYKRIYSYIKKNIAYNSSKLFFCLITLLFNSNIYAKNNLELEKKITVGHGYSDNINLENTDKVSSQYTEINPALSLNSKSKNIEATVDYNMQGLIYHKEDKTNVHHNLLANTIAYLAQKSVIVQLNASVTEQLLDSTKNISSDNVSGSDNLTTTYTYSFNTTWNKKWNNTTESNFYYEHNWVNYVLDEENNTNSIAATTTKTTGDVFRLELSGNTGIEDIYWQSMLEHQEARSNTNNNTLSTIGQINLLYRYSSHLNYNLTLGHEKHQDIIRQDSGLFWESTLSWSPNAQKQLDISAGERFYGSSYGILFSSISKRLNWSLEYKEDITSTRDQLLVNTSPSQLSGTETDSGEIAQDNTPINSEIPYDNSNLSLYLAKRFTANMAYRFRKSTHNLDAFHEKRNYIDIRDEETNYGVSYKWDLAIAKRTSLSTSLGWLYKNQQQLNESAVEQDIFSVNWSLERRLNRTLKANLSYSYQEKNSANRDDNYKENKVFLNLDKSF